jgi:Putative peptidoglycan binding domain
MTDLIEAPPTGPRLEEVAALVGGERTKVRRTAAIAAIIGLALGAGGAVAASQIGKSTPKQALASVALQTVAAQSRDVNLFTAYAGTLGYGAAVGVVTRGAGVLTSVPAVGTDLTRGQVAFDINDQPVALMYGDLPAWRSLSTASTPGPDILQLETNLAALGYGAGLTVDETFTAATAKALKAFETAIGMSNPSGVLDPSQVVFSQGPIRVDSVLTRGTTVAAGTSVITAALLQRAQDTVTNDVVTTTTTPTQAVTFTIPTTDQGTFKVGDAVTVVLADASTAAGAVSTISNTPRRNGSGPNATLILDVTVAITTVPPAGLIEGPANVDVTNSVQKGLTMVPLRALVALEGGGYAVSVVDKTGVSKYVAVATGVFQDGWVQVTGKISAGDLVQVPA